MYFFIYTVHTPQFNITLNKKKNIFIFEDLVQQVMGLLAFPVDTPLQPYRELLDPARWQALIQQFRSLTSKTLQVRAIRILKTVFFSATDRLVNVPWFHFKPNIGSSSTD